MSTLSPGNQSWNAAITTSTLTVGGYSGIGYYGGYAYPTTTTGISYPITTTNPTFDIADAAGQVLLTQTSNRRLTPDQFTRLLREHQFIPLEDSEYCMLCYALDKHRRREQHGFIIHEQ